MENKMTNTMPERFDKRFAPELFNEKEQNEAMVTYLSKNSLFTQIKKFIQSEIDLAVANKEKEIVERIESEMRLGKLFPSTTCHQIINLITTK